MGLALLLNAAFTVVEAAGKGRPAGGFIISFIVGLALLAGRRGALPWARGLSWLSLIVGSVAFGVLVDPFAGVGVGVLSVANLLLLAEPVRLWRVVVGGALTLAILGLATLGTVLEVSGQNPFAAAEYAGKTDPLPADRVIHGKTVPFTYRLPEGGGWAVPKPEVAAEFNKEMEGWAIETHRNVFVGVIVEKDVSPELTLKDYSAAVREGLGGQLVDEKPQGDGVVLHLRDKLEEDNLDIERLVYLQIKGDTAVQVHTWGQDLGWSANEPILREVLASFKL